MAFMFDRLTNFLKLMLFLKDRGEEAGVEITEVEGEADAVSSSSSFDRLPIHFPKCKGGTFPFKDA